MPSNLNGQPVFFLGKNFQRKEKPRHQIWGQEAAGSLMFARLKMWDAHDHNGLHPNVLSALSAAAHFLYCLRLLSPGKVVIGAAYRTFSGARGTSAPQNLAATCGTGTRCACLFASPASAAIVCTQPRCRLALDASVCSPARVLRVGSATLVLLTLTLFLPLCVLVCVGVCGGVCVCVYGVLCDMGNGCAQCAAELTRGVVKMPCKGVEDKYGECVQPTLGTDIPAGA